MCSVWIYTRSTTWKVWLMKGQQLTCEFISTGKLQKSEPPTAPEVAPCPRHCSLECPFSSLAFVYCLWQKLWGKEHKAPVPTPSIGAQATSLHMLFTHWPERVAVTRQEGRVQLSDRIYTTCDGFQNKSRLWRYCPYIFFNTLMTTPYCSNFRNLKKSWTNVLYTHYLI